MCGGAILRQASEGCQRRFAARLYERGMPNQSNALEVAFRISAAIKGAAIKPAGQPVVANEAGKKDGRNGALGEEGKNFSFVQGIEFLDCHRTARVGKRVKHHRCSSLPRIWKVH